MKHILKILILFCILGIVGCASPYMADSVSTEQELHLNKKQLLEIAKQEVAKRETWTAISTDFPPLQKEDGTWMVLAWGINSDGKLMQGRQRLISIDKNGKVIEYIKGH